MISFEFGWPERGNDLFSSSFSGSMASAQSTTLYYVTTHSVGFRRHFCVKRRANHFLSTLLGCSCNSWPTAQFVCHSSCVFFSSPLTRSTLRPQEHVPLTARWYVVINRNNHLNLWNKINCPIHAEAPDKMYAKNFSALLALMKLGQRSRFMFCLPLPGLPWSGLTRHPNKSLHKLIWQNI